MKEQNNNVVELGTLFDKKELKDIQGFIKQKKWKELREYLNSQPLKSNLFSKGVLADYIYYWFEYKFKDNGVKK